MDSTLLAAEIWAAPAVRPAKTGRLAGGAGRSGRADDGLLVAARAHAAIGKNAVIGDPFEGLLVDLPGIGLEHQTLARTPAARIHGGVIAQRELVVVVMRVAIRTQVDVALRPPQRAEELAQIL